MERKASDREAEAGGGRVEAFLLSVTLLDFDVRGPPREPIIKPPLWS